MSLRRSERMITNLVDLSSALVFPGSTPDSFNFLLDAQLKRQLITKVTDVDVACITASQKVDSFKARTGNGTHVTDRHRYSRHQLAPVLTSPTGNSTSRGNNIVRSRHSDEFCHADWHRSGARCTTEGKQHLGTKEMSTHF